MPRDPQGAETRVKECEGCCVRDDGGHSGEVVRVNIRDAKTGRDFGPYWYCDNAIAEDRRRGFAIERITITERVERYPLPPHAGEETKGL